MSYCEDLSTFLDKINDFCQETYEKSIQKEQQFITYQAIRNYLGHGEIKNKSEATDATQFMNQQLKELLKAGVLVHSKKASQKKMTIVGKLYVEMPNYYKDNVEAISERMTNASICEPSDESEASDSKNAEESNTEMTTENLQLHDPLNESPEESSEHSDNELSPVYPPQDNNSEISYDESGSEVDTTVPQSKRVKFNEKPQIKNLSDSSSDSESEPEPPAVPPRKPTKNKKQAEPEPETKKSKSTKKPTKGRKTTIKSVPEKVSEEEDEDSAEKVTKPVKGRRAAHKKATEVMPTSDEHEQAPKKISKKKKNVVSHLDQSSQDLGDPVTASTPMIEKPVSKKKKKKSPTNKARAIKSKARRRSSVAIAARKSIEKAKTPIKSRIRSGIVSKKKTAESPDLKKAKGRKKKTLGKKAKA